MSHILRVFNFTFLGIFRLFRDFSQIAKIAKFNTRETRSLFHNLVIFLKVVLFISLIGFHGLPCLIYLNFVYVFILNVAKQ